MSVSRERMDPRELPMITQKEKLSRETKKLKSESIERRRPESKRREERTQEMGGASVKGLR